MTKEQCRSKNVIFGKLGLYNGKKYQILAVNTQDCLVDLTRNGEKILNEIPCEDIELVDKTMIYKAGCYLSKIFHPKRSI
ncbi:MAG: hypothetical protein PHI79_07100 [Sulfurovaceae bacterium]|nr:hypothetical protein [Sulfurovaceae bacterium]